jgi:Fe-S cluster assembly protein SufD
VELAEAGLGAEFSRLHLTVDLEGRGADARITGAYFGDMDQTLDYRYFMNHLGANTTSEMFLKGAVAGDARSVFTGLIRIEPSGQGTNAHQTNRNLVLSDDAEAHSVPNLEILANDVRCGHGSAVGPLDEEQRYYLMSRGLPEPRADRLQVLGFFEEALQRFPQQQIEPTLRGAAMAKYDRIAP